MFKPFIFESIYKPETEDTLLERHPSCSARTAPVRATLSPSHLRKLPGSAVKRTVMQSTAPRKGQLEGHSCSAPRANSAFGF